MTTKDIGNLAENLAARYLEEKGYEILEKNYKKPWGEIDIIASLNPKSKIAYSAEAASAAKAGLNPKNGGAMVMPDGDDGDATIIFVEVKANKSDFSGIFSPEERVNEYKRNKIARVASFFMENEIGNTELEWRIDVLAVTFDEANKKAKVRHYKGI